MRFRVLSAAQIEATESALWYEDQQSGLADDFFTEMQKAFERIRDKPQGLSSWNTIPARMKFVGV